MALTGYEIPLTLDVRQTAELLNCNPVTVRKMIKDGKLRSVRVGDLIRVSRSALLEFLGDAPAVDDVAEQ